MDVWSILSLAGWRTALRVNKSTFLVPVQNLFYQLCKRSWRQKFELSFESQAFLFPQILLFCALKISVTHQKGRLLCELISLPFQTTLNLIVLDFCVFSNTFPFQGEAAEAVQEDAEGGAQSWAPGDLVFVEKMWCFLLKKKKVMWTMEEIIHMTWTRTGS